MSWDTTQECTESINADLNGIQKETMSGCCWYTLVYYEVLCRPLWWFLECHNNSFLTLKTCFPFSDDATSSYRFPEQYASITQIISRKWLMGIELSNWDLQLYTKEAAVGWSWAEQTDQRVYFTYCFFLYTSWKLFPFCVSPYSFFSASAFLADELSLPPLVDPP